MNYKSNKCGYCHEFKMYPLVKVPLGPPDYSVDEKAAAYGIDHKEGIVLYSSFCLICARKWLAALTEEFLTDGTIPGE